MRQDRGIGVARCRGRWGLARSGLRKPCREGVFRPVGVGLVAVVSPYARPWRRSGEKPKFTFIGWKVFASPRR